MDLTQIFNDLWGAVFSQAGLAAGLLFLFLIYQTIQLNRTNKKLEEKNNQVTSLAVSQIASNKDMQNLLDKIADLIIKDRETFLEKIADLVLKGRN